MDSLIVQKYGGTSVGNLSCMSRVAKHVQETLRHHSRVVVVVSAMGKYTDELLTQAHSLHPQPPKRELDMLVTTGERVSMSLLCIALDHLGVKAVSLTGSQSGILTDETHGNARIHKILGERIQSNLADKKVVIVAGFQGVSPKTKEITSLGRGGSDLTAIALAIALKADSCEIYTDVQGVFTCDPRKFTSAKLLPEVPWQTMCELAWAGAGVLHHRSAFLAWKYRLPVHVRSSFSLEQKGTLVNGDVTMEKAVITAITARKQQVFVQVRLAPCGQGRLDPSELINVLWQQEESPLIFQQQHVQQQQSSLSEIMLTVVLSKDSARAFWAVVKSWEDTKKLKVLEKIEKTDLACVSVVGQGLRQSPEVVQAAFDACQWPCVYSELKDATLAFVVSEACADELISALGTNLML